MNMNAVLLSAGYAERLRPLTNGLPKCLLPATSKGTMLNYWVELLDGLGIEKLIIATCWQKEEIRKYVNRQCWYIKNKIQLYEEDELEPSGQALYNLSKHLGKRYLIVNSDTYIKEIGVRRMLETDNKAFPIYLGVTFEEDTGEGSLVTVNSKGAVISFVEKPKEKVAGYSYAGIMVIDNKVTRIKPTNGFGNITPDIVMGISRMSICNVGKIIDIGRSVDGYYEAIKEIRRME